MDWRSFTLYVAKAMAALLAIVTHGLIAQYLGLAMYGQFSLFIGLSFLATQLGDVGATMVGAKEVSEDPQQAGAIQRLRFIGYSLATVVYLIAASMYGIDGLWMGAVAVIAFFGITDWSLRGQGMPHKASFRQVMQGVLQVLLLTLLIHGSGISSSSDISDISGINTISSINIINPLSLAIAGFAGGTLLSTLFTWKSSYAPLRQWAKGSFSRCKQTYQQLKPAHAGVLLLHAQYQLPLLALPVLASAEEAGRYGAAYVVFAGLSAAIVITQDIFLPKSSDKQGSKPSTTKRHYIAWQLASIALPVVILSLLPTFSPLLFGEDFVMGQGLAWGFIALTLAFGLRYVSIQMRLFKRQYHRFARLNGLSLLLQLAAWVGYVWSGTEISAGLAVLTLAGAECLAVLWSLLRPDPVKPLHVVMVTHQGDEAMARRFKRFNRMLGSSSSLVLDTSGETSSWAEGQANDAFEFGAYLTAAKHLQRCEGPCLIVNDRLLVKRFKMGWLWLLRSRDRLQLDAILGDLHREKRLLPGTDYLSSWLFYFPGPSHLQAFKTACEEVIARRNEPLSPELDAFVSQWLEQERGPGHRGPRDAATIQRKRLTIGMEHELSKALQQNGASLANYPGYAGPLRWLDQLCNRLG